MRGAYNFSSLVDFLQARPRSGDLIAPGSDTVRGWRQSVFSGFFQEEFRASERVSVTAGLRYEAYTTPSEVNGKVSSLRDPLRDSAFTVGDPVFRNPSRANFAPRLSIALLPFGSGKTVIRAGAGIFRDMLGTHEVLIAGARVPPFFTMRTLTRPSFPDLPAAMQGAQPENQLDMLDYYLQQPYAMQFQFLIQQELAGAMVFQIGYAGARGVHLPGQIAEANPVRPGTLADGSLFFPTDSPRLNPAFGRTRTRRTEFDSSYHGFQAQLQRRWRSGLLFQAKYTWGKSLDNTTSTFNREYVASDGLPTMFNYRLNRGRSDFNLEHTFSANLSWSLPAPGGAFTGRLLGGWELQGLAQAQTGPPFNPFVGFDRAWLSAGSSNHSGQRPVYLGPVGAPAILGDPERWFDPNLFGLPPAGMYGNLGRNVLDAPGLVSVDLAMHKVLWRTDRHNLRLRVEAFNLANHPNFQTPSGLTLFTSSLSRVGSAGQITDTTTSSRQIQLALKWLF